MATPTTFTVSERNNEIVIGDETFYVKVDTRGDGCIWLEIDGGCSEDEDGALWQNEENYQIATLYETAAPAGDSYDNEFDVVVTSEMVAKAAEYRAMNPHCESEF